MKIINGYPCQHKYPFPCSLIKNLFPRLDIETFKSFLSPVSFPVMRDTELSFI